MPVKDQRIAIRRRLDDGATLEELEKDVLGANPGEDERDALWLYAWLVADHATHDEGAEVDVLVPG